MPEAIDVLVPRLLDVDVRLLLSTDELPHMALNLVRFDTRPVLRCTVRDANGVVVDITGATPRLRIRRKGATAVLVTKTGTIVNGTGGIYDLAAFTAADYGAGFIDAAGHYEGEHEITFSDGSIGSQFEILDIFFRDQIG